MMEMSGKEIVKSRLINSDKKQVWDLWTTSDGLKNFFGRDNQIELTPGGAFEIYFLLDAPVGYRGSEGCKILSYLPERMLSFSWNAPPNHKVIRENPYKTWVVVEFKAINKNQTEVLLTHTGWPVGDDWAAVFDYFNEAWDYVMDNLEKYTHPKSISD